MTHRSVRLTFLLIACAVVSLTLSAPFISYGQTTDVEEPVDVGTPSNDATAQQLENDLQELGISPDQDTTEAEDASWSDRITGIFREPSTTSDETGTVETPEQQKTETAAERLVIEREIGNDGVGNATPRQSERAVARDPSSEVTVTSSSLNNTSTDSNELPVSQPVEKPADPEAVSLDELLLNLYQTKHAQEEYFVARLAEHRRIAIALRSTLEAAEQVAEFGHAGTELLRNAPLDTIVAMMIAERDQDELEQLTPSTPSLPHTPLSVQGPADEYAVDELMGFAAWRPVYVVDDTRGNRIGWRHIKSGQRLITYVGESSIFDGDAVTIVDVVDDTRGRTLIIDVNEERHEILLF